MKTNTATLQDLIIATKCRKGKAAGITAHGAYWLAIPPIKIRRFGGDGIGQTSPDLTNYLELRHYRNGTVCTYIRHESWHQNYGHETQIIGVDLEEKTTIEEVQVKFKNMTVAGYHPLSDYFQEEFIAALSSIGLPEYEIPSPDDEPETPAPAAE